jgi:lipopolysaccharide export system protein LptA
MAFNPHQLRKWFLYGGATLLVLVLGFYSYARIRLLLARHALPARLAAEIQSSTQGFTLSKSQNGRTLFTIHAAKAIQYKNGGHAELQDVNIVVFGKSSNRFDQIYGSDFEYDPKSGDVTAHGEVQIDLEGNADGPLRPDQAPPQELKNLIHVRTSGLVFNQQTGIARTPDKIDFRLPQASGTAIGATYNSKEGLLDLKSQVALATAGASVAKFIATSARVIREPRQAVLENVRGEQKGRASEADKLTIFLRPDSTVEKMLAVGNVRSQQETAAGEKYDVHASQADIYMAEKNQLRQIQLSTGVTLDASGKQTSHGRAQKAVVDFGANRRLRRVHATGDVHFQQMPSAEKGGQTLELIADGADLFASAGGVLQRGVTQGAARIEIEPQPAPQSKTPAGKTVVTAGVFNATFDLQNRLRTLHGEPQAKIDWQNPTPGGADRISTSRVLDVTFDPKSAGKTESVVQQGNVHYVDSDREAFAQRGRYTPQNDLIVLTGAPRVLASGTITTAATVTINRQTGEAVAESNVKSTYTNLKPQPGGAMLAGSDPIHVTANSMHASRASGAAHYAGGARLWQGGNIVQAPAIDFLRDTRSMAAQGSVSNPVRVVFLENGKDGKTSMVNVTSSRLTYLDGERLAQFEGNVVMTGAEGKLTAQRLDIFLKPRTEKLPAGGGSGSPVREAGSLTEQGSQNQVSRIDHAVAQQQVVLQQPTRVARGERLLYTADDGTFVLTGKPASPPIVSDAAHGTVSGDSLTFYNRDDRVLVKSESSARTVTHTSVQR